MIIEVNENTRVLEIEESFAFLYPYLKLELEPMGGLEDVRRSNTVEIKSSMNIAQVRRIFSDELQMFAKLFRKTHGGWINISEEDQLTLKQQNDAGREETAALNETRYEDFFETEY